MSLRVNCSKQVLPLIKQANELGATPLYIACYNGHWLVVDQLLTAGANINRANGIGATPLFVACYEDVRHVTKNRSASNAAMQPVPAAVIACR